MADKKTRELVITQNFDELLKIVHDGERFAIINRRNLDLAGNLVLDKVFILNHLEFVRLMHFGNSILSENLAEYQRLKEEAMLFKQG